jgi:hypothetical protein
MAAQASENSEKGDTVEKYRKSPGRMDKVTLKRVEIV